MGLFRKKTVKAAEPTTTTPPTSTTPALASTSETTETLSPRAATPEHASTAAVLPVHHEETHALSTDHAADADAHQREVEAKEADQQRELDHSENRDSLAGGPGGLGSSNTNHTESSSYPQEKVGVAPLQSFGTTPVENGQSYPQEKVGHGETSPATHENGVQDDGMMKGFVPVPGAHAGDHSHSQSQDGSAVGAATPVHHEDEKSNHHVAEGAALGGLAGVGAAGAGGAFANGHDHHNTNTFNNDRSIVDPVQQQQQHVPAPIQTSNLAATSPITSGTTPTSVTSPTSPPLSASAMAKIQKNEYKDGKKMAKVWKQESKDDQKALDAAIKELGSLQKIHRDAIAAEAKAAKHHNDALKVEQKANVRFLKEKAIYDKAHTAMKGREEELEINRAQAARQNTLLEEQTAKVEQLRETKAREDRERAQKLGTIKRK